MRVPLIRQSGASDCGVAVLEMVLRHYGLPCERHELRRALGGTEGGSTLESLRDAARALGLDAEGFDAPLEMLGEVPTPAILHWRQGHFVVLEGFSGGLACIADPARGRLRMSRAELSGMYGGTALVLEPAHPAALAVGRSAEEAGPVRALLAPWLRAERGRILDLGAAAAGMAAAASASAWGAGRARSALDGGWMDAAPSLSAAVVAAALAAGLGLYAAGVESALRRTLAAFLAGRFARVAAGAPYDYLASRTPRFLGNLAGDIDPTVNPRIPPLRCMRLLALALAGTATVLGISGMTGGVLAAALAAIAAGAEWRARRWNRRAARWRPRVQAAREWAWAVLARPAELRAAGSLTAALARWNQAREQAQAAVAGEPVTAPGPHAAGLGVAFVVLALLTSPLAPGDALAVLLLGTAALTATHVLAGDLQLLRGWMRTLATLADAEREAPRPTDIRPSGSGTLHCRAARYAAGGRERLSSTTLEANTGAAIGVTGDAEARAALAQLILGLVPPSGGEVTVGGVPVWGMEEARRGPVCAGVLSGAHPVPGTLLDNFRVVHPACTRADVLDACARVGLSGWLAALPLAELTPLTPAVLRGEVPRLLCLARLLPRLPRVLVLDGTLDELDAERARALALDLGALPCTVVLCTGRPEIIPPAFRSIHLSSSPAA
ncbi:cysteine peptidase family C39 domain-containing protein [Longimicrobium terrae]|uniref:ABC-type transport system involved in cytochrome bd biosynthesis fused ATPase/permease subunit n=1 Tax=Longimicrobium terrae TaxID=1639882 RepID=A0A841H0R7_9BACT|nr:ABC-type transport system involved in cytochrome bd biosynthesis fused ATPase/permease subunit [Longimicrobium terrae]MBB6071607.1 ABC-type transport system involved in cytochrome bd biosynthesis fused ATPase/permease subunit [Longimicrobium terrae]NNC29975.1 hypothetical protein [Longimicrobium terrae]